MTARSETWRMPAGEFAQSESRARMSRVLAELERATQHPDEEAVHDLRVAIRRLSQALRIFSGLLPAKGARKVRQRLKVVLDAAAVVRDLDVGLELLLECGVEESEPLVAEMRLERKRAELFLVGQVCLLRSEDLEKDWSAKLGWEAL